MPQWSLLTVADHDLIRNAATDWKPILEYLRPIAPKDEHGAPYDHQRGGKLPRAKAWRPYRLTMRNALLAVISLRYSREDNCIDVDICAAAEPTWLKPREVWRAIVLFILSEAYKSGSSMAIRFQSREGDRRRHPPQAGQCPPAICELAMECGVPLRNADEGYWTPKESRSLYVALTPLSAGLRSELIEFDQMGRLSAPRVCYFVHRGIWTSHELDVLIRGSRYPEITVAPDLYAEHRRFHGLALEDARRAALAGVLHRALTRSPVQLDGERMLEREDENRKLDCNFLPEWGACEIRTPQRLALVDWVLKTVRLCSAPVNSLEPGKSLLVLIRPHIGERFLSHLNLELEQLSSFFRTQEETPLLRILAPFDVGDIATSRLEAAFAPWSQRGVALWCAPDDLAAIDQRALRCLTQMSVTP